MVHREWRPWQHNIAFSGSIPLQPALLPPILVCWLIAKRAPVPKSKSEAKRERKKAKAKAKANANANAKANAGVLRFAQNDKGFGLVGARVLG
jgi:hypothetical protein